MEKHRLRRTGAALITVVSVVTLAPALGAPAQASHGGTSGTGVMNTPNLKVCTSGSGAQFNDAIRHADAQISPTEINIAYVDCHSGEANLTVIAITSPETFYGNTRCLARDATNRCTIKTVRFNTRQLDTQIKWRRTSCHEFGHVADLGHRGVDSSCMGETSTIVATYDGHDTSSIDALY